jgi:hypothetical protein
MRSVVTPLLAAILLLASAGVATADTPATYVLDAYSCVVFDAEGNFVDSVPAGSEILVFEGWIANTRGQVQSFVNNATWILEIDGESVNVEPYLSGVMNLGPFWGDLFTYPAGALGAGESLHTHYDNVLKSASFDGVVHWAKGSLFNGGVDCTVTASAD